LPNPEGEQQILEGMISIKTRMLEDARDNIHDEPDPEIRCCLNKILDDYEESGFSKDMYDIMIIKNKQLANDQNSQLLQTMVDSLKAQNEPLSS